MTLICLFEIAVTISAGILVLIALKKTLSQSIQDKFNKHFVNPHTKLNERCNGLVKDQELIEIGVLALLHDRVYQACQHHLKIGVITVEDFNNLTHLYKAYVALRGNGTCKELYERVKKLKFVK